MSPIDQIDPEVMDDIEKAWSQVEETLDETLAPPADLLLERSGWKTVRIFVSSTFKDFHHEREVLVKQVNECINMLNTNTPTNMFSMKC